MSVGERLGGSPAVRAVRDAVGAREGVWIVGGAVREAALGADVVDVDLAVAGDESIVARAIASTARGPAFPLSERFGTWRVLAADRSWGIDVTRLRASTIDEDLALRDFTVNALAVPAGDLEAEPLDPLRGLADLEARLLRAVSARTFRDDPLRVLRAARIAAELSLEIEPGTAELARGESPRAAEPAGERQFAELRQLVVGRDPLRGLRVLDELGATAAILPELEALRGVEQNPYHHLDVHGHTIEVLGRLLDVESDLVTYAGEAAGELSELLAEPLADELTRGGALRFGALVHDLGKPESRTVSSGGRIMFLGHDEAGARIVRGLCRRFRVSRTLLEFLAAICRHHLRLGFLVHEQPLRRRSVFDYLVATDPYAIEVTLLTVADRLATQGERTEVEAIESHLGLAGEMFGEALAWRREGPPRPPIRGDELAAALGIDPGPELGRLLAEIQAATFAGEVSSREEAVAFARAALQTN